MTINGEVPAGVLAGEELPPRLVNIAGGGGLRLQFLGNRRLAEKPGVGICGSRRASEKSVGLMRESVTRIVEENYVVVSGNAAGIDREAHLTALQKGGETILVLPQGIGDFRVPLALRPFWDWKRALVVSEFPENMGWTAWNAMRRNRTIIGLSRALVVMEAGDKGGTLAAGMEALRVGTPLHVFQYDKTPDAPGNTVLLRKGGRAIQKKQASGKPNLEKLLADVVAQSSGRFAPVGALV